MRAFIGTKFLNARPMTRAEYCAFRGWTLPDNENETDKGWLVEYLDGGKAKTRTYSGYVSWSPDEQFQNAYREVDGLSFGLAIEALKKGCKVARAGWNGKGMWLILISGRQKVEFSEGSPYQTAGFTNGEILPHIDMYTVNSEGRRAFLPGWVASQTDMLADDWCICE